MTAKDETKVWFVEASTGCSCCSDENFTAGPFLTEEEAQTQARIYEGGRRLASRYAKNGRYYVHADEAEPLGDGRFIVGDVVWGPSVTERSR